MYSSSKYNSSPLNIASSVVFSTTSFGCFTLVNWKVRLSKTGSFPFATNTGSTVTFVLFTSGLVPGFDRSSGFVSGLPGFDGCSGFDGSSGFVSGLPGFDGPSGFTSGCPGFDCSSGLTSGLLGATIPSSTS